MRNVFKVTEYKEEFKEAPLVPLILDGEYVESVDISLVISKKWGNNTKEIEKVTIETSSDFDTSLLKKGNLISLNIQPYIREDKSLCKSHKE